MLIHDSPLLLPLIIIAPNTFRSNTSETRAAVWITKITMTTGQTCGAESPDWVSSHMFDDFRLDKIKKDLQLD